MDRVLIVEDEEPVRRLLRGFVQAEGLAVLEAPTAEEALEVTDRQASAVALCDVNLPGRDGLWLVEQFARTHPEIAIVMTTGVQEFETAVTSLRAGVTDYLAKPFTREGLSKALKRALEVHHERRASLAAQLEDVRRQQEVTAAFEELEVNAISIATLFAKMHARDQSAVEHIHRVSRLSVDLALALHIQEPHVSDIERAALLHEISLPALGGLIQEVPFLASAAAIAVAAKTIAERKVVPRPEDDLVVAGAAILAVADAYDELVSGATQQPTSVDRAIESLASDSRALDPAVLRALRALKGAACATLPVHSPSRLALSVS